MPSRAGRGGPRSGTPNRTRHPHASPCARQYTFLFHNNPGNVTGTEAADNHPVSTQGLGKVGSWGVDLRKRG